MVIRKTFPLGVATAFVRLATRGFVGVTTVVVVALLVWLAWTGREIRNEMRAASLKAVRVAELRGSIDNLNDWLTMAAQLAASSGEPRWVAAEEAGRFRDRRRSWSDRPAGCPIGTRFPRWKGRW